MNEYLESLVRIENEAESTDSQDIELNEVEESIDLPEAVEEAVDIMEEDAQTPMDERDIINENKKEEQKSSEGSEGTSVDNKNDVTEEVDSSDIKVGQELNVTNIRIYNSPDVHQVSKLYSGKVIYCGQIDRFAIVKYMKHGFGLIQGYSKGLI